ncbi:MAG: hypothetical protein HOP27_15220 [Anaerolineales bacterium]|nr:hypothetical protein [Anaerolineales bacterium]
MPTKALAQSAPASTDEDDKKRLSYILSINPIDQHLSQSQYDDYDCFIASMFMALDFFDEEITYNELIPIVRGNDKNGLSADSRFVYDVTEGRLLATGSFTNRLASVIESELRGGRPVVVAIKNMSLLAEHWNSTIGHAVIVYGVYNKHVFYIDPFNGERYTMPTQSFIDASLYPHGSFAVTFEKLDSVP